MLLRLVFLFSTAAARMHPKIVGGGAADIKDWPFIASLFIFKDPNSGEACGGSLISSQTILTAAHCLVDEENTEKTPLSSYSMAKMGHAEQDKAKMIRRIVDYEAHDSYDPARNVFDIAIMFLAKPVTFSNTVKKVLLMNKINYKTDKLMMVAGWGAMSESDSTLSPKLKSLPQNLMARKKCKEFVDQKDGVLCAADFNSPEFPYSGDSGGPLMKAGSHYQMGVVSFRATTYDSRNGATATTAYTSVPFYYKWIQNTQHFLFSIHCKNPAKGLSSSSEP